MSYVLYHNTQCSKSRATYDILKESGVSFVEKHYLKEGLVEAEIRKLITLLGVRPIDIVRTQESEWGKTGLSVTSHDDAVIVAIVRCPKLLERPILVKDGVEAVIGRPPENVKSLIKELSKGV